MLNKYKFETKQLTNSHWRSVMHPIIAVGDCCHRDLFAPACAGYGRQVQCTGRDGSYLLAVILLSF